MDRAEFSKKKQTPAQQRERLQWQLDAIRENQGLVTRILGAVGAGFQKDAKRWLGGMHKSDRDAILQEGGIFTDSQLEILRGKHVPEVD